MNICLYIFLTYTKPRVTVTIYCRSVHKVKLRRLKMGTLFLDWMTWQLKLAYVFAPVLFNPWKDFIIHFFWRLHSFHFLYTKEQENFSFFIRHYSLVWRDVCYHYHCMTVQKFAEVEVGWNLSWDIFICVGLELQLYWNFHVICYTGFIIIYSEKPISASVDQNRWQWTKNNYSADNLYVVVLYIIW